MSNYMFRSISFGYKGGKKILVKHFCVSYLFFSLSFYLHLAHPVIALSFFSAI